MEILSGNNPLNKKYPFICVTNGGQSTVLGQSGRHKSVATLKIAATDRYRLFPGGSLESERCQRLSKELGVEVSIPLPSTAHRRSAAMRARFLSGLHLPIRQLS